MSFDEMTQALTELMEQAHYGQVSLYRYQHQWRNFKKFLLETYDDESFDMEKGFAYLQHRYNIPEDYDRAQLSQQQLQHIREIRVLDDYRLHGVLTQRSYANWKHPIVLCESFETLDRRFCNQLVQEKLSQTTQKHYTQTARDFLDYMEQRGRLKTSLWTLDDIHGFIRTLGGYATKTIATKMNGLRRFLKFLYEQQLLQEDLHSRIHDPKVLRGSKIPSSWKQEELKQLLEAVDRNDRTGKRDYAMLLLACVLGLRIGDIKRLRFSNIDWENKKISLIQHKTKKPLELPLPDQVGWALIDYIKNSRPSYFETDYIFIKHMPPFDSFAESNCFDWMIEKYMHKAGIRKDRNQHRGFHSLRHSAGSLLLEIDTPVEVISEVLGHSDIDITGIYLKADLKRLTECVLSVEEFNNV